MPFIKVDVLREDLNRETKQQLIRKISEAVTSVLNKDPHLTHIVINEIEDDNWGYAGEQVSVLKEQGFSTGKK
ncbi:MULTISPECIES: 4-oxalocrotonate tautomerase family protein [Chryseobacterium]|uniref:tautomerase family protein n=1 Tax=Chryseobacterium TaxID=59732 RepID=UPI000788B575|nr:MULTISPECIES: 4-oxalocrotonate tautomerase family protein [Chryseobacterium]KYH05296.1 4-oxalocrotonate tautomerase [Chryseobacterium cucumeris]MCC3215674.1 4-oxalocrotonate tautomerase family protein [Chryseobacterium sp. X308]PWW20639.1 4-oxalocrotonate tautomerase [Chryseobacterium sp. AG844]QRA41318.1 4-oxalocrotonate tautomerase family protein [Chryseobacterium cucumeris]QWT86461.1 4-oxalocrotonate tautomerase family protein [Chryseobacterium sp. PCH239]